jgi:hypothetical protein
MRRSLLLTLSLSVWTLLAAPLAFATGVFQSVRGEVTAAVGAAAPVSVAANQQVVPGSTVATGPGAQTVIRFDDGQIIVLNENTEFRIAQYSFNKAKPQSDNIVLRLLKGAMRSVSGLIASRNHSAYSLFAPQATIGIRGTDFMTALANNSLYTSVTQGAITASNAAGSVTFSAGATGFVASPATLPVSIAASQLPASVASAFSNLSSVAIGAAGAGAATGAATGGITAGMVAAGVAVVGVAAAASSSNGSGNASTTTTTTTQ